MASEEKAELQGPDLTQGIPLSQLTDGGMLTGHAHGKAVLLARQGSEVFAIGTTCTHYGGPLAEGLLVGDTVRCPWHHACFSLRTGEALRAPALNPVACWTVEQRDGNVYVTGEVQHQHNAAAAQTSARPTTTAHPSSVVIIGAGAAGNAAAEMLRREGYAGSVTMIGPENTVPYDRPNLSKDYLAGTAPEEWIPLRSREFYREHKIKLILDRYATAIDVPNKRITLDDSSFHEFGALLLATGAEPIRLPNQVDSDNRVYYLRSLADSRTIIGAASHAHRAVVIGASFIGLEVAASLRTRNIEVHVVAPESRPLERILGKELGDFIRDVHQARGVTFHLGRTASQIDASGVTLDNGARIPADIVVAGIGVRPRDKLAEQAGLPVEKGVIVNEYLETNVPGIFAAGDIARYPDPRSGTRIRVEHWVVAERQGQTAARNILGRRERFDDVPFFWSQHYDTPICYVGHAEKWDAVEVSGDPKSDDGCTITYRAGGKTLAVATVGRDRESLEAEVALERAAGVSPAAMSTH